MRDIESKSSERTRAHSDRPGTLVDGSSADAAEGGGFDRGTVLILVIGAVVVVVLGFLIN